MERASIRRFRLLLVAAAVFYPAWSILDRFLIPAGIDGVVGRFVISALCLLAIAASAVPRLARRFDWICLGICCAIVTHNAYLVSVNDLNLIYVVGYTLVVFALSISFESQPLLVGFIIYTIAVTMFSGHGDTGMRHLYSGAAILALSTSYLAFRDKLTIMATLRRKNEELETTQMFLKSTAQVANIGGWTLDVASRTLWWSDQTYAIHDLPVGALIDSSVALSYYAPEARGPITDALEKAVRTQASFDLELPLITASGRRIWARIIGKPVIQTGKTTSIYGSVQDITDQRKLKEEDRRLNQLLTTVLDNLPLGIYAKSVNDSSKYILWNRGMESLFQVKARDVLGQDDGFLYETKEAERIHRVDEFVMDGKSLLDMAEEEVQTKLVRFPAHTVRVPVLDGQGEPQLILGILEDITETKNRESLIRNQQTQLLHASRMSTLGEMSGGVAHEINNPLTVIMGLVQKINLSLEAGKATPENLKMNTAKILAMAERIAKIVRGLRTFAREASQDPFHPAPVRQLIDDSLDLCRQRLINAGIDLEIAEIPDDLVAHCRSVQISQVMLNLLNNSHDAIQDQPTKWIKIAAREYTDSIEISVMDSGNGIPPEIASKILQPFFSTKEVGAGTGLGLSISKGIIESHKGKLYYDSSAPHTRFVITLPKNQTTPRAA